VRLRAPTTVDLERCGEFVQSHVTPAAHRAVNQLRCELYLNSLKDLLRDPNDSAKPPPLRVRQDAKGSCAT